MLRKVKLYGELAEFVGHKEFEIQADNLGKIASFLIHNFPDVEKHMNPKQYQVKVGAYVVGKSELNYPISNEDFIYWEDIDLAVIAIEGSIDETENFQVLEIGGIWHPLQQVYSVGFPFVLGNNKNYRDIFYDSCVVNAGILDEEGLSETSNYSIVHDCAISGGMSGGPLVSEDGKLIAVNGLKGVEILEQGWSGQITYTDFDNLNHAYGIHIYDLYLAALNTESGNFDPGSKFYNFLPRLSLDEHESFYDFLLNE